MIVFERRIGGIVVALGALALGVAGCDDAAVPETEETTAALPEAAEREHTPIRIEQLSEADFRITGAESQVDFVRFETEDRYFETLRDEEVARGDYVLTPDGRLCFMRDGNGGSDCWRQVDAGPGADTITLELNHSDLRIELVPIASAPVDKE